MRGSSFQEPNRNLLAGPNLIRIADSGVLDSIPCPKCGEFSVSVRFTHPADNEYRSWFLCSNCDFRLRVQNSGRPPYYSEELVDERLQTYDREVLRQKRIG